MKSAGKVFSKMTGFRGGRPVNKHSSFTTLVIGAAFGTGYLLYKTLKQK